jgi:hypothetical protein
VTGSRRPAACTVALVASLALAGCSTPAPRAHSLPGVSVRVLQYRSDIAPRQVQLEVVNASEHDITVDAASLHGSGYSPALRWSDDDPARILAGTTVDLPAALTTASCDGPPVLSARLRLSDGTTRSVPAVDSHGTLAALHRQGCFAGTAARTASVAFGGFTPHGRTADLTITVRAGESVSEGLTVARVLPTTLLSPAAGATTWEVDRRFTGDGRIVLRAAPTRCDLHAIAEDKVGSVLPVQLRLADGTTGTVNATASAPLKNRILAWVVRACGTG